MGKSSKHRFCPAIAGELRPAECGAGRNSVYRCPATCPHNPLGPANYDQLLAVEDSLDAKTFRWTALDDPGREAAFASRIEKAQAGSPEHGLHAAVVWHIFFERDAEGCTSAQRWERTGFRGLSNDERVLLAAKMKMRIVLLEIQQVVDAERTEALDLLADEGTPLRLLDRSFAAQAVRFASLLGWAYPLPHFWRLSGTAVTLSEFGPFSTEVVLAETVRHLGGPESGDERRRWLAEHFEQVAKSITATAHERLRRMYASMDALWGHAVYELRAPYAECRAVLDAEPALEPAAMEASERAEGFKEVRTWFDDSAAARAQSLNHGRPLLGTIQMKEGSWKIEASSGARLDRLRRLFEERLGQRVRFVQERRDDLGARLAAKVPVASDPSLIPPRLLEQVDAPAFAVSQVNYSTSVGPDELTETVRTNIFKTFPDDPVPMLDGRTPREAAKDPKLRKRLLALMKIHVRGVDEENLRKGTASDINPLLRELGLHELDFPPPPRRPATQAGAALDDEDAYELPPSQGRPGGPGPLLPPLPSSRPLTTAEAEERFQAAIYTFDVAAEALGTIAASGSTLVADLLDVTAGLITDEHCAFLIPLLIPVWFALVPQQGPIPQIPAKVLRAALIRDIRAFASAADPAPPDFILREHRQPEFARIAIEHCLGTLSQAPKKMRPKIEEQIVIAVVLCTVINELDRAIRSGRPEM